MQKPRSNFDINEVLHKLPRRQWLRQGDYCDNNWEISFKEITGTREDPLWIRFGQPIMPWPNQSLLTDPRHSMDLLTAKLMIFYTLEPPPLGRYEAENSIRTLHRSHINFIRWRLHVGIGNSFDW